MGDYDLVSIVEWPNDKTAATTAMAISSRGNARTTTMRLSRSTTGTRRIRCFAIIAKTWRTSPALRCQRLCGVARNR
ncbi:MAG: GYD domain-containing protein [Terriglobales bacterium]